MIGRSILRLAPRSAILQVVTDSTTVIRPSRVSILRTTGVPGPAGPEGPQGPPGGGGGGGSGAYTHNQPVAASTWIVSHNLGYRPAVSIWDTAGDMLWGEIDHINLNQLQIVFSDPVSGSAYMS